MAQLVAQARVPLRRDRRGDAPVLAGALVFFLLFAGYFMLRPVRETMGVAGGVDNLQWLFTGTFVATLAVMPLFGWIAAKVQRRHILPWTFGFFAANLVVFALCFQADPENLWIARTFYIWISVFNLIAVSVAWSVLRRPVPDRAGQAPVRADGGGREPGRTGRAAARHRCWWS